MPKSKAKSRSRPAARALDWEDYDNNEDYPGEDQDQEQDPPDETEGDEPYDENWYQDDLRTNNQWLKLFLLK